MANSSDSRGKIFAIAMGSIAFLLFLGMVSQKEESGDWSPISTEDADVSIQTLLVEMSDRSALARWPEHAWVHGHRSSTDRPVDSPKSPGWHANNDAGHYAGMTRRGGRPAYLLLDREGPGVITRIWSANPGRAGMISVFVDGEPEPVIYERMDLLLSGRGTFPPPFAGVRGRGATAYLPIPYAKNIRITIDESPDSGVYYGIDYRTYPEDVQIQSYSPEFLVQAVAALEAAGEQLRKPTDPKFGDPVAGSTATWDSTAPGAIAGIRVSFPENVDPTEYRLRLAFDGEAPMDVRVGDFFGSGSGVNPFRDWNRTVTTTSMTARWVMPFADTATVQISPPPDPVDPEADDVEPASLTLEVATIPWEWDARTLRFGMSNQTQREIPTRPRSDWGFAKIEGQRGVFVGDTLRVFNPVSEWWGAGDERFWVDNRLAQVGTGTEDYYGYAYCSNELFAGPFGGQPRNDQEPSEQDCGRNAGHVTNTRVRMLDKVLFNDNLRFELEIWHHADTHLDYSGTAFWYSGPTSAPPE